MRIPHVGTDQANAWLARAQAILSAWKQTYPQADDMIKSIEKNIQTVQDYKEMPLQIQAFMNHIEKYLYDKLGDLQEAQNMMYRWQLENGESLADWNKVHDYNQKQLGNIQEISNILHKFDQACGHRNNERHSQKYQRWKSIFATMPKFAVIDMPRFADPNNDFSGVDQSIDVRVPVIDFEALPLELPDAPLPQSNWDQMRPMTLCPDVPSLPSLPETGKLRLPNLP